MRIAYVSIVTLAMMFPYGSAGARAEMATLRLGPPREPVRAAPTGPKATADLLKSDGSLGVVRFDLTNLPKGAQVYRADLLIARTAEPTVASDEAKVDIEVYPLLGDPKRPYGRLGTPAPGQASAGVKPLALRGPWFDRLDATDAVRQWLSGKPNEGFLIKACPRWDPERTFLDVAYEGPAADVPGDPKRPYGRLGSPPQAGEVQAAHRAGQTFITWKEIEDLAGQDELSWRELRSLLANLDAERQVRYCVYRSDKPITAANLAQTELVAEVKPLSAWNVNGRSADRAIDDFIASQPALNFHQGNPFERASANGQYGQDCPIDRLVIANGQGSPLPRGTGLYVHSVAAATKAYYAVVTSVNGVQNTRDLKANLAGPIDESPGEGEPVLQRELPPGPLFDYQQTRLHYVQWVSPPLCNLPSRYFNWSVGVPRGVAGVSPASMDAPKPAGGTVATRPTGGTPVLPVPLELNLHRDARSYWRTHYRLDRQAIVLQPHDFAPESWWYGYHERQDTLKSFDQGVIHPYTERRLLRFIEWAAKQWPVDRGRICVTGVQWSGGSGALRLGLRHPEVFSLVVAGHGISDPAYMVGTLNTQNNWAKGRFDSMQAAWGKLDWAVKTDTGLGDPKRPYGRLGAPSVWDELNMNKLVADSPPSAELPMLSLTFAENWQPCRELCLALLDKRQAVLADMWWGGERLLPVAADSTWPNPVRQFVSRERPLAAFRGADAVEFLKGNRQGDFNKPYRWQADSIVDQADRCEITLYLGPVDGPPRNAKADVTLRRLRQFKPKGGAELKWTAGKQSGQLKLPDDGVLTIPAVEMTAEGVRLVVTTQ